jgi:hypothetical protein
MGLLEKIKDIEAEMARTQKNKATEYHLSVEHTRGMAWPAAFACTPSAVLMVDESCSFS